MNGMVGVCEEEQEGILISDRRIKIFILLHFFFSFKYQSWQSIRLIQSRWKYQFKASRFSYICFFGFGKYWYAIWGDDCVMDDVQLAALISQLIWLLWWRWALTLYSVNKWWSVSLMSVFIFAYQILDCW